MGKLVDAVVYPDVNQIKVQKIERAAIGPDQALVKTMYTMVSTGTELRVLGGHYGAAGQFPLVPGYSYIGQVAELGDDVRGLRVGDLVAGGADLCSAVGATPLWGGQMSEHLAPAQELLLLPAGAKALDYVITELGAISGRGVAMADPVPGESAVVLGQGTIGALSAALLTAAGCHVTVLDIAPGRLERARAWSAVQMDAREMDAVARVRQMYPQGVDIVVESAGNNRALSMAFEIIRREPTKTGAPVVAPRLVLQANYLEDLPMNLKDLLRGESLRIFGPIDRRINDRQRMLRMIESGRIKTDWFLDQITGFQNAPQAYSALRDRPNEHFSIVFEW